MPSSISRFFANSFPIRVQLIIDMHNYLYFQYFTDGPTGSGDCFSGRIGVIISGFRNRGVSGDRVRQMVQFTPIPGLVNPEEAEKWLEDPNTNKDIRTIIKLSLIVQSGPPAEPFTCVPGPVHNARWVTTGSNILYLYTQEPEPWDGLIKMVKIVLNLYVPSILNIKENR